MAIIFFLDALRQKEILDTKVAEEAYLSMAGLSAGSVRKHKIIADRGKTTIADIMHLNDVKRNTAKTRLKDLVACGFLVRHGVGKGSWYARGEHP